MNTAERNAEIFRLHNEGSTYKELAVRFNLTANGVKYIVNKMNKRFTNKDKKIITKNNRSGPRADKVERNKKIIEMYHSGVSLQDIAEQFGLKHSGVSYVLRNEIASGRENIRIRNESILNMHSTGFSVREIAKRFDLTDAGVRYILKHNKTSNTNSNTVDMSENLQPLVANNENLQSSTARSNRAIEIFVERYGAQYTTKQIADMWGTNASTVANLRDSVMRNVMEA